MAPPEVAVSRPKNAATKKIKKAASNFVIEMEKTKDILLSMGELKKNQLSVEFVKNGLGQSENGQKYLKIPASEIQKKLPQKKESAISKT